MENKKNTDSNPSEKSNNQQENPDNKLIDNFSKKIVTINLVVEEQIKTIVLIMSSKTHLNIITQKAITQFNKEFEKEKSPYILDDTDPNNYALQPSKKDGYPKEDAKCIDPNEIINNLEKTKFNLVWKSDPQNYNIYLKKANNNQGKDGCVSF